MKKSIVKEIIMAYKGDNKVNDNMKAIAMYYITSQPLAVRIKMMEYMDDVFKRRSGVIFIKRFQAMLDECGVDGTVTEI